MSARRRAVGLTAVLALGAGLLAGWQVGAASAGRSGPASGTTATTVTQPPVTAVVPPAKPAEQLPGTGKPALLIADSNTPEQFILGQLYFTALTYEGYKVIPYRNLGPWDVRVPALHHGTLDLYPESLGAWNSHIAHLHTRFQTLSASYRAADAYARRQGLTLLPPTPFSDTSCVAVLRQYAAENHVYSIPQLAHGDGIIFGAAAGFNAIADGLPALEHAYHLHPNVQIIGNTQQYSWLNSGNVQAADCNTTDPQLASPNYVQLSDPKHVFGWGNVVAVTTPHVLAVEGTAFRRTIEKIDALLTLRAMRGLNAEYELGNHSPTAIAYQFLQGNGIIPPSRYAPVPNPTSASSSPSS